MASPVRVLFSCTGVGIFNRGIESFFREAFDGLKETEGLDARLIKGRGDSNVDEWRVNVLPRTGRAAPLLGKLMRRNGYVVEQWSSFPGVVRRIREFRPHVIFYSDANLGFLLYWFRKQIGMPYRLLFSNGGPCAPPYLRMDSVHQVAPEYFEEAIAFGEPTEKHFMVPYGIRILAPPKRNHEEREKLRLRLGVPVNRPMVLSVGWIARRHKRMDYVIQEVARLPEPRPYLQLLGAMDEQSQEIVSQGHELLGADGIGIASVPYEKVADYYKAADIFVLASLKEGFGRVYLEAMMHGLPVIAHRVPVTEFVLSEEGELTDLSRPGNLASSLQRTLSGSPEPSSMEKRWRSVSDRFSWQGLAPRYLEMFRHAALYPPALHSGIAVKEISSKPA